MQKVRGYMGKQRRYKGVEGICRRVRGYMVYRTKTIQGSRGYMQLEGYGDIWESKDDTREQRVYVEGTGIYGSTKTIQGSRGYMQKVTGIYGSTKMIQGSRGYMQLEGYGDIRENKDDTREERVYVERYGKIWENKDDTREQRGYVEGYGDI